MIETPDTAPAKRGRGRPKGAPTDPLNIRVPRTQLALLEQLRGPIPPGTYVGQLFEREAKRRKITLFTP